MTTEFDPRKFIDREFEQELFEELLQFKTDARLLSITDSGGKGKSQLLRRLQHRCMTVRPRIPVSLIALDQLADPSPLAIVKQAASDLMDRFGVPLPDFDKVDKARLAGDFMTIRATIDLQGASFEGAREVKISGAMATLQHADTVVVSSGAPQALTPEQESTARDLCVRAFFDDLKRYTKENPVVLMLDAYERAPQELKTWIVNHMLERYFFDISNRPQRLVLVVAGRETPRLDLNWSPEDCSAVARSVDKLGTWEKRHVEECLRTHGYIYEATHVELFYQMISQGMPPSLVVQGMESILRRQQP